MDEIRLRVQHTLTKEQHEALERAGITVESNPGTQAGEDPGAVATPEPPREDDERARPQATVRVRDEDVPAEARRRVATVLGWDADDDRLEPA